MIRPNAFEEQALQLFAKTYSQESQIQMAFGECGEFVTLAGRMAQGRASDEEFVDEIADNILMMAQMRKIFGEEAVDKRVKFKIDRLKNRIDNHSIKGEV